MRESKVRSQFETLLAASESLKKAMGTGPPLKLGNGNLSGNGSGDGGVSGEENGQGHAVPIPGTAVVEKKPAATDAGKEDMVSKVRVSWGAGGWAGGAVIQTSLTRA